MRPRLWSPLVHYRRENLRIAMWGLTMSRMSGSNHRQKHHWQSRCFETKTAATRAASALESATRRRACAVQTDREWTRTARSRRCDPRRIRVRSAQIAAADQNKRMMLRMAMGKRRRKARHPKRRRKCGGRWADTSPADRASRQTGRAARVAATRRQRQTEKIYTKHKIPRPGFDFKNEI